MKQLPLPDSTIIDREFAFSSESRPGDHGLRKYDYEPGRYIRNT